MWFNGRVNHPRERRAGKCTQKRSEQHEKNDAKDLEGGRFSVALLLSAAMALGGTPAAALAEGGSASEPRTTTVYAPDYAQADDPSYDVKVDGDVKVSDASYAIGVMASGGYAPETKAEVTGGVSATADDDGYAYGVYAGGSADRTDTTTSVSVGATKDGVGVSADAGRQAVGVEVYNYSYGDGTSKADVSVAGDVEAGGAFPTGAVLMAGGNAEAALYVGGDLKGSGGTGLYVQTNGTKSKVPVTVLVDGTISGKTGVQLDTDASAVPLDLNAWKIESTAEGGWAVSAYGNLAVTLKKSISYIVRKDEASKSLFDVIGATSRSIAVGKTDYQRDVAKQGATLTLALSAAAKQGGYYFTGATNGEGDAKVTLEKDADGNYFYVVPEGGGVLLAATLDNHYDISYDLAGGTLGGAAGTVVASTAYGTVITLPTPTREGYKFLYWLGSQYNAGDEYKVEGAHTFTAVWEKVEEPEPEPKPEDKEEPTPETKADEAKAEATAAEPARLANTGAAAASRALPPTGDAVSFAQVAVLALAGAGAIVAGRRGRGE